MSPQVWNEEPEVRHKLIDHGPPRGASASDPMEEEEVACSIASPFTGILGNGERDPIDGNPMLDRTHGGGGQRAAFPESLGDRVAEGYPVTVHSIKAYRTSVAIPVSRLEGQ